MSRAMNPSADLRARVLGAAAAQPSRTRSAGRRLAAIAGVASVMLAFGVFELAGGAAHSADRAPALTFELAGGWTAFAAAIAWLTLGRGGSTLARRPVLLAAAALVTPLACFAWMHVFAGTYVEPFARVGYRCLALTLAMAALPLASFLYLRRGIEPRRPSALGAAAGATFGAWAGVLVDVWCPLTNSAHALFGHVLPLALLATFGALAGRRLLALRRP